MTDFIERPAKLENPNRREVPKTVTTLSAASSLAGVGGRGVEAAGDPGRNPALARADQTLREAVVAEAVGGVVAIGATENGVIYSLSQLTACDLVSESDGCRDAYQREAGMSLDGELQMTSRFATYLGELTTVVGHASRVSPVMDFALGYW